MTYTHNNEFEFYNSKNELITLSLEDLEEITKFSLNKLSGFSTNIITDEIDNLENAEAFKKENSNLEYTIEELERRITEYSDELNQDVYVELRYVRKEKNKLKALSTYHKNRTDILKKLNKELKDTKKSLKLDIKRMIKKNKLKELEYKNNNNNNNNNKTPDNITF